MFLFVSILLLMSGCGSGSQEIAIEPWEVLLADLEYAWNFMNIYALDNCFRDDLMHHQQEVDWYDYNGDGIIDTYWGLDLELHFAETAFNAADSIFFTLSGSGAYVWPDDSTGKSIQIPRILTKEIWFQSNTTLEV